MEKFFTLAEGVMHTENGCMDAKMRRGVVGFVGSCFDEFCQNHGVMLNLVQHLLMLINTINIDRLRVEPAMTGRLFSMGEREQVSCAKRTVKHLFPYSPIHLLPSKKAAFTLAEGATHVALSESQRKVAFTIAEILITLGIIGVVAAITIPSLISKYQMKTFEIAFKKQYAVFQDAINFISLEDSVTECSVCYRYGDMSYNYRIADCQRLKQALIERLGLSPIKYDYPYAKKTEILAGGGKTINGACSTDDGFQNTKSYITKDGAIVLIHKTNPTMTIDVNGKKGPNKWGYDVFYFTLTTNNSADRILLTDELCSVIEKGGRFPRTILQNRVENKNTSWFWK